MKNSNSSLATLNTIAFWDCAMIERARKNSNGCDYLLLDKSPTSSFCRVDTSEPGFEPRSSNQLLSDRLERNHFTSRPRSQGKIIFFTKIHKTAKNGPFDWGQLFLIKLPVMKTSKPEIYFVRQNNFSSESKKNCERGLFFCNLEWSVFNIFLVR